VTPRPIASREALYDALPGDWLLRQIAYRWADELPAYALGGAVLLHHHWGDGDVVVLGDPHDAAALVACYVADAGPRRFSLPEEAAALVEGYEREEGWAFRWTATAPPVDGTGEWLGDDDGDVRQVLEAGFPDASMPVGHPDVRRWAGVRRDGALVAVAADASQVTGLGFLASVTTLPEARGTGAGVAVTAWATARLVEEHGHCGLWLMAGNTVADRLYTRLGYADEHRMAVLRAG
jgi:GNAT superfamily N-acetyltransferase